MSGFEKIKNGLDEALLHAQGVDTGAVEHHFNVEGDMVDRPRPVPYDCIRTDFIAELRKNWADAMVVSGLSSFQKTQAQVAFDYAIKMSVK